jgi:hypothetical protein
VLPTRLVLMPAWVLALVWSPWVAAHDQTGCAALEDDRERLACYDAGINRVGAAQAQPQSQLDVAAPKTSASPTVAPAATAATAGTAAAARDADTFGWSASKMQAAQLENGVLTARIATVDAAGVGRWAVTLDNGQRWEQRESATGKRRPQAGDEARIEEAALGSFLLRVQGKGSFRVRRVK